MTHVCKARPCSTDRLPAGLPRVDSIVGRCSLRAAPAAERPIPRASAERNHALVDRVHSRAQNELGVPRRRPRFLFPGKQRRARVGISFLSIGHEIDNQTSTQPREMNMNAFKQTLVAIAAAATLGATGLASIRPPPMTTATVMARMAGMATIAIPRTATATAIPRTATATAIPLTATATVTATGATATAPGSGRFPGFPSTRRDFHRAGSSSSPPTSSCRRRVPRPCHGFWSGAGPRGPLQSERRFAQFSGVRACAM
jgi:hypothetical protein